MTAKSETTSYTDNTIEVAGLSVRYLHGGDGPTIVVLHHSTGSLGWLPFYDLLAENYTVLVPDLPGYGQSERPAWAREPRDIALILSAFILKMDLSNIHLIGFGLGGFLAAEIATFGHERLDRLILVGAAGVKPKEGEIVDQMLIDFYEYVQAGFSDLNKYTEIFGEELDQATKELWDYSREMTARISWAPYMFSRRLLPLLSEVDTPTLLLWGEDDRIVPLDCGKQYEQAIPNSTLKVLKNAGHLIELEDPQLLFEEIG